MKAVIKALSILLLSAFLLTSQSGLAKAASPDIKRLGDSTRIETAINIASEGWTSADNVVIANAFNFADALAGVPLAAALDAPILLTDATSLSAGVSEKIAVLGAKNVYILGGTVSVSAGVESTLKSSGRSVMRIAGSTRFEASTLIAKALQSIAGTPSEIFIAYGFNYPDALAISPVAGATKNPVIYAPSTGKLDSSVSTYLKSSACKKATILGGYASVDSGIENSIKVFSGAEIGRISGSNRYETALSICKTYSVTLSGDDIAVSTGESFPDALAGGAFAAKYQIPVILVGKNGAIAGVKDFADFRSPAKVYVFSGTAAVSDAVINSIIAKESPTTPVQDPTQPAVEDKDECWLEGWYRYAKTK